jgi:hypothetical protein
MIRAAGLALLICAGALIWQYRAIDLVRADLATARARVAGYEAAAQWRRAQEAAAVEAAALDLELSKGVGADAPVSDYLRGGAGRVWP